MITSLFEIAHKRPLLVLGTHVPWLLFWIAVPIADLIDGNVLMKRQHVLSYEDQPAMFLIVALMVVGLATFCIARIVVAILELYENGSSKSDN